MLSRTLFKGMETFLIIWSGQIVSLLGTAMTRFALLIWAYQQTGQATTLALLGFFAIGSGLLVSPIAGVAIDRYDRRVILWAADLGAGLATIGMLALYATGNLQVWHLFVGEALSGICEAFQIPAYIAATTMLVPKEQYARATGMRSMARAVGRVIAPFLAGILLPIIHIDGIMTIDVITFFAAIGAMLIVRIPRPPRSEHGAAAEGSFAHQARFAFGFIFSKPGLVGLVAFFALTSLFSSITYFSVLPAMILARAGGGELALASVQSALGAGALVGSLVVSAWGGPKRRVVVVLIGAAMSFALGDLVFAFGQSLPFWIVAGFCGEFFVPLIIANDQAIWQAKVAADVQGRVFAARFLISDSLFALGFLIAGPIADGITGPTMLPGGKLAVIFGPLVGVGPGAGIAMMFIFTGAIGIMVSLGSLLFRPVRDIETDLPDAPLFSADSSKPEMVETAT